MPTVWSHPDKHWVAAKPSVALPNLPHLFVERIKLWQGKASKLSLFAGTFSADAQKEADREGVLPIELVDGERLVELFQAKELGVRQKQVFEIDHAFFDQFR